MLKLLLAILYMLSVGGICYVHAVLERRRYQTLLNRARVQCAEEKATEREYDEPEEPVEISELEFDINPDYYVEDVPYCDDGYVAYVDILRGYHRWNDAFAKNKGRTEIAEWLVPALGRLEGQCDAMDFAKTNIQRMLNLLVEKGFTTVAGGSAEKVQDVLNTFDKNREESVELLRQIDCTDNKKLLKKLKSTLLCLMDDNDELINGLDTFQASIRNVLSEVCEDQNPDHITDFTSLHELLKVPSTINRVLTEVKAMKQAEESAKTAVPTIDVPATDRRILDYFPDIALGTKSETASEIIDPETSSNPMSDGF